MRRAVVLALALTALAGAPADARAAPRVVYPEDGVVVTGGGVVHVLAETEQAAGTTMTVTANGGAPLSGVARPRGNGSGVAHAAVALTPGLNTLAIALAVTGGAPVTVTRRVFYAVPLVKGTDPPHDFRADPFHRAGRDAACTDCHVTTPGAGDAGPAAPAQSTCFSCHAGLTRAKEVHGPAAQWACTRCHDPAATPVRYATPERVMPLCYTCHTDQKDRFFASPFQHGPTATGQCTICHNPHGTANAFFLKKATWDLCTTCHAEKGSGRHVISWGPSGQGHPTRDRPDPSRGGGALSCASCHNPHAAATPKLWNFGARVWVELCRNCHRTILGG